MEKKLVKNGNSYGLLIDKALFKAMRFTAKTEFEILPYNQSLVIRRVERARKPRGAQREPGKKLIQSGYSFILVIGKPLLDLMEITPETPIEVRPYGRSLLVRKHVIKLTREEKAQRKLQEAYEAELRDPMHSFENLDEGEKSPSERLVLVDGKWVLPKPGHPSKAGQGGGVSRVPDRTQEILEAIRKEEKEEKKIFTTKKRIHDSKSGIQKKEKVKKVAGRPGKVGKW